jgi:hypothetical protein
MERVLAAQEAAEQVQVRDRYYRPTGDAMTDALLADLRRDESAHARDLVTMRGASPNSVHLTAPRIRMASVIGRGRGGLA